MISFTSAWRCLFSTCLAIFVTQFRSTYNTNSNDEEDRADNRYAWEQYHGETQHKCDIRLCGAKNKCSSSFSQISWPFLLFPPPLVLQWRANHLRIQIHMQSYTHPLPAVFVRLLSLYLPWCLSWEHQLLRSPCTRPEWKDMNEISGESNQHMSLEMMHFWCNLPHACLFSLPLSLLLPLAAVIRCHLFSVKLRPFLWPPVYLSCGSILYSTMNLSCNLHHTRLLHWASCYPPSCTLLFSCLSSSLCVHWLIETSLWHEWHASIADQSFSSSLVVLGGKSSFSSSLSLVSSTHCVCQLHLWSYPRSFSPLSPLSFFVHFVHLKGELQGGYACHLCYSYCWEKGHFIASFLYLPSPLLTKDKSNISLPLLLLSFFYLVNYIS